MCLVVAMGCWLDSGGDSLLDKEPDDMNNQTDCEQIIINESLYNSALTDDYLIKKSFISNDSLMVLVQYGGGCGPTDFDLLTNGLFMESDPVQLDVFLSFSDQDPCEAAIQKMLCFDLSNLAVLYNDSYQTAEGTIIIHLNDSNTMGYDF